MNRHTTLFKKPILKSSGKEFSLFLIFVDTFGKRMMPHFGQSPDSALPQTSLFFMQWFSYKLGTRNPVRAGNRE